ncbi:Uncharacterised protein [uncultured archaeon]|nr:Uncharacterised protein [uncultured archaeon]
MARLSSIFSVAFFLVGLYFLISGFHLIDFQFSSGVNDIIMIIGGIMIIIGGVLTMRKKTSY